MRAIARDAGVDPALLRHYFDDKATLFLQAARLTIDPRELVSQLAVAGPNGIGVRLLELALPVWDSPAGVSTAAAIERNAKVLPVYARLMAHLLEEVAEQLMPQHSEAERHRRIGVLLSVIGGLFITRYVSRLEPVASMPVDEVVRSWGPLLQQVIDAP